MTSQPAPLLEAKLGTPNGDIVDDLILDIGRLRFIDATGLSVFVSEHKRLCAQSSNLVVVSPTPRMWRLFHITGLTKFLLIDPPRKFYGQPGDN